jgi:hypothetical protein
VSYREPLPDGCPPEDSDIVLTERVVFRIVKTNPPTEDDFRSQRAERPRAEFFADECVARGLSVHTDEVDSLELLKLPRLRGRMICQVTLLSGAGRIKQTGRPSHHTWWPLAAYDILSYCAAVQP